MISKIIHLCWLSGDNFPLDIQLCIDSWKEILPEYEVWLWGKLPPVQKCYEGLNIINKHFDINSVQWTKQAFEVKKYAFAADYIRLYALYHYGGIYLDSDVIVYKSFNNLLYLPYFIGEDQCGNFEPAIIGSEKGNPWIKQILDRYTDKHFVLANGIFDTLPLPAIFYQVLSSYKFRKLKNKDEKYLEKDVIYVFSKKYFNSRNNVSVKRTKHSYCAHAYRGSWVEKGDSIKDKIRRILPKWMLNVCLMFTGLINYKRNHKYTIPYENS